MIERLDEIPGIGPDTARAIPAAPTAPGLPSLLVDRAMKFPVLEGDRGSIYDGPRVDPGALAFDPRRGS
jgi:hypothetical protein